MNLLRILLCMKLFMPNYVVYSNGEVLEEYKMNEIQSIASTSKIMTALLVIEQNELSDIVTIDESTTHQIGSSIYLKENEQFTILSLIFGLMLQSGNDAAYILAIHTSGSIEAFSELMNEKSKQIGMNNTLFRNPSGLDENDGGNLSTCYDLALLMEEAMKNEVFRIIVNTKRYIAENDRIWMNKNKLLFNYEYANGGKTGYTQLAGKTLVTSASKDDFETIVVSFKENEYFDLHEKLHQSIYDSYNLIRLIDEGKYKVLGKELVISESFNIIIKDNVIPEIKVNYQKDKVCLEYTSLNDTKRVCFGYSD